MQVMPDIKVNFLECIEEEKGEQIKRFGWVTDLELRDDNVKTIAKGGRARWKIENETFNTLKNSQDISLSIILVMG